MNEDCINVGDYLNHHGVKGMKWGVRKQRPTSGKQNANTKKTSQLSSGKASTKDRSGSNSGSKIQQRVKARLSNRKITKLQAREAKAKAKLAKLNKEKQVKALEEQVSIEDKKAAILKSRSGKELYKNADLFTTDELAQATRRLQLEKTLREIDPKTKTKAEQYMDKAKKLNDTMNTVTNTIESGAKMYQTINKYFGSGSTIAKDEKKKD